MIKDRMDLQGFGTMKFPTLKGKVKITLHNFKNGKNRIIEGENIISSAIPDILKYSFLSGLDAGKVLPLVDTWFGGILVYEQAHTLNADNYNIPNDTNNHLFAHAGDEAPASAEIAQEDLMRGSPIQTTSTDNSITHVWEWGHSQGNSGDRYIRSLALCHKDIGNAGLGNTSTAFQALEPFAKLNYDSTFWNSMTTSANDAKYAHAMYDDANTLSFYWDSDSGDITVDIKKLAYLKTGVSQTMEASLTNARSFTITPPFTLYSQPYYYFDRSTKYLWIFYNLTGATSYDNDDIRYFKIDCENEALVDLGSGVYYATIHSDSADIAPLGMGEIDTSNILKVGDDLFFPRSDNPVWSGYYNQRGTFVKGYQRINLVTQSDQDSIDFNDVQKHSQTMMGSGDILINNGRVINGLTGYTCATQIPIIDDGLTNHIFSSPDLISSYVQPYSFGSKSSARYLLANKFVHTTLYNIPNAYIFHKTASESMTISYTIEET